MPGIEPGEIKKGQKQMKFWEEWQKLYRYGLIVIQPPDEIRELVNKQREEYDPLSQSYSEAHITVTQPLLKELSEDGWDRVLRIIEGHGSFQIDYGPINSFLPYPCIWYEIQPAEKILDLRQALHRTGFYNLSLPHTEDFIPHLTITEGLSGPTVDEKLFNQLQGESCQGTFLCQQLTYIVPDDKFNFKIVKTLPLGTP